MNGTEKQITWAEKIKARTLELAAKCDHEIITRLVELAEKNDEASDWIDNRNGDWADLYGVAYRMFDDAPESAELYKKRALVDVLMRDAIKAEQPKPEPKPVPEGYVRNRRGRLVRIAQ